MSFSKKVVIFTVVVSAAILLISYISESLDMFFMPVSIRVFLLLGFYGGLGLLLLKWLSTLFSKKAATGPVKKSTTHGSAEWAKPEQFCAAGNAPADQGLWLGDFYRRSKSGHLMTIAGSGSGKNTCIIFPNLLINPFGSYVVTDPKGENAFITARFQKEMGQRVYILDPWGQQEKMGAKHGIPAAGFNPFDFFKRDPSELRDNCELIARYLVPDNHNVKDPFWNDRGRTLIKTCLLHIVTSKPPSEQNFWSLYKMLRLTGDDWLRLMVEMKKNTAQDGLVSIAAGEFMGMDPMGNTLTGILSTAQNATSIFESPQLRQSFEKSEFNPYDLANGNVTVYIVIPERYMETHSGWLRLVVGLSLKAINARPNKRVNFLLDEFAIMGRMVDVQKAYAFGRGQNIVMWTFAQSLAQVKEIYGEDGMNTLLSNTSVFQAFGVKDQYTRDAVSRALGSGTLLAVSASNSTNEHGTTRGETYSNMGRPLLFPDEIETFPQIIVLSEGLKFFIKKIGYHENRFDGLDWKDTRLTKENSRLIKAGVLPPDLREIFAKRADPPPRILA